MNINIDDTIVAISTPLNGESGIGIVRMSGKSAINIADKIFISKDKKKPSEFKTFTVHYGWISVSPGNVLDEVLLTVMRAPKTYTREDIVEISGHGGPVVLKKILTLCMDTGARIAQPGEFTKRAFLNGRIDLAQAQAVCDLICAKTDQQTKIFINQVKGALSEKIKTLRSKLIGLIAQIEVSIDHPEEDMNFLPKQDIIRNIGSLSNEVILLIEQAKKGKIYEKGLKAAIIGKPNVGKSSLLNILLAEDRAIVTHIPGTTRDIISETFNLKGIPVTLMDTAGIRKHNIKLKTGSYGKIEQLGIERAKKALNEAEIILFMCDVSRRPANEDKYISELIDKDGDNKKTILILNKKDLGDKYSSGYKKLFAKKVPKAPSVKISALRKENIDKLESVLYDTIMEGDKNLHSPDTAEIPLITNIRYEQSLIKCKEDLNKAIQEVGAGKSEEFIVIHLRQALDELGKITGETTTEEIIDSIFSQFCIGK
ncbi:MAG: tRNA uridine-5-carboxymethylaminomethyl(34) synthesis GTPase MnmE [Elusimicrobia bacterium CG1_02_37_114]|nr:MAG: tRNA uridine-5-carboxymethylaminomethyl(34) synthesis GTPase MnmE [Elusimicrobia bacterium CG1_02_37_114]PIV53203.1 MAG: tRNA uridine-5-carboxymethylaminomethyl(34) synthesis GTPase MnmE [Elusimicrobia bacterium CG02_land_8_20_14_3_00_37_13]PIZ14049.1 MAG: tRNA uridine-5-carboxymethylaminomethyl(34) synthesis GTPase MnmE [Elusimicrobia bacterium CG_4_10_14_0_8_um_filter_37_32]